MNPKPPTIEQMKERLQSLGITPKTGGIIPEHITAEIFRMTLDRFQEAVLMDASPLQPVVVGGQRYYRLSDIFELAEA